jgi:hypothetical protein
MSADLVKLVLDDAAEKMAKAVEHARKEFSSVRTGRAAPALVEKLPVEYYGSEVPLQQLAGFQVPEARLLVISPYDKSSLGAIEKALQHSDLGLNPSNDGAVIRLAFPQLTAERRKELVKVVKHMAEEGRLDGGFLGRFLLLQHGVGSLDPHPHRQVRAQHIQPGQHRDDLRLVVGPQASPAVRHAGDDDLDLALGQRTGPPRLSGDR